MTSNFLQQAPASAVTLLSTELNAIASGSAATSSVAGTAGVFTETTHSSYPFGGFSFNPGGAFASAPSAGAYLAGWFLRSPDGTNFETIVGTPSLTSPALPRSPDFIIPIDAAVGASGSIKFAQGARVPMPFESYKLVLQNMTSQALAATGNTLKVQPSTIQY
jgi:hypothetical protein